MSKTQPPFDQMPEAHLVDWVKFSLESPLGFGDGHPFYGVVQNYSGETTLDAWGYLARKAGYPGHVGLPLPDETRQLWEKAGWGDVTRDQWARFTQGYCAVQGKDAWLTFCRIWFGSDVVKRATETPDE
jgi:hypothetical protein